MTNIGYVNNNRPIGKTNNIGSVNNNIGKITTLVQQITILAK